MDLRPPALSRPTPPWGNLVHEIRASGFPVWSSPIHYTISLQTTSEPYGLTIHFDSVTAHCTGCGARHRQADVCHRPSLLALIGNLGQVQWTYAAPDGTAVTRSVTLEEVDQALPDWIEAYNLDAGADWTAPESVKGLRRLTGSPCSSCWT